ncbi:fructoselysine 6-kinase [Bacillus sp. ISL-51]|uniref:fructoselysine 6-kinase n=1 Tax=Bacteria TaxID=2 RepID=UPI001BEBD087|nr:MULTISPECIES: fructoselysine 6-kinase [Bacteria]MBT2574808.1 fructoselysine 6-kinase [Bacillus sp. ISL-51]MBT2635687.1 fructoselysine 6-kinase [Bacillus sp. ISL-26]MBT2714235.1 fructoselysine 6-kinase [Pseudomonas sp. ISL-88]
MKLIAVGDNVVDYYQDQETFYPGGNALNVAVLARRLGHDASYIGILGSDEAAAHLLNVLKLEKVNTDYIRQAYGENGMAVVTLDERGDRIFVGSNKGGVQSRLTLAFQEHDVTFIREHDVLHTSVYSRIERDLPNLCGIVPISFDFSTKREDSYLQTVCPYVTYAFFSGSDLSESECVKLAEKAHGFGVKIVCLTRGEHGAVLSDGARIYHQPIVRADIIDTLGAGDSFIAGFLTAFFEHQDIRHALLGAAQTAAKTCGVFGAFGYGHPYKPDGGKSSEKTRIL